MAENTIKLNSKFYWDTIVFKVEDELFCVPRSEFVQSSEVFADMFLLPSGPAGHSEGQDRDHPIVLEGYKKDEFMCLLKVMYPTAGSLISGPKLDLYLEKEEWVSVLKLSTIWNMTKIRNYAIHRLSTDVVLSPVEKILLARSHRVAAWLEEGVTSLASVDSSSTLEDLATLGWETAARILWVNLRDISSPSLTASNTLHFRRYAMKCKICSATLMPDSHINCNHCGVPVTADAELLVHGPESVPGTADHLVQPRAIKCKCGGTPFSSIICSFCFWNVESNERVRITADKKEDKKAMIKEMFRAEIEDYELAITVATCP